MIKDRIILGGLILLPIVLAILPADFFDGGPVVCISRLLADMECWGCGMTRACMNIIHFNFSQAWQFNKLSFIVFPILSYLYVIEVVKFYRRVRRDGRSE